MPFMDHMSQEPTEDCLIVNMISTGMYHAIHTCTYHVDYTTIFCRFLTCDPWMAWNIPVLIMLTIRQSSLGSWHVIHEWHDTYLYLSCWLEDNLLSVPDMWSMNSMIHTCTYHVDYKTIVCRFLTCDPWMAWYIHVLIMLTIRQSSVGSWDMWSMNGMIHTCTYHVDYKTIFCRFLTCDPWMDDKYRYVSCHSWITCQEPTEDCLIVNMISTGMYHAIHGSHVSGTDRRLTCDPWMAWYIHVLIMLTIRQSSVGSWQVIHEWHDTYLYLSCWL
jgi:hypothetical protein